MAIGFRVLKNDRKVEQKWIEQYRDLPVANVSDSMNRMTSGGAQLRPMHKRDIFVGQPLQLRLVRVTT